MSDDTADFLCGAVNLAIFIVLIWKLVERFVLQW